MDKESGLPRKKNNRFRISFKLKCYGKKWTRRSGNYIKSKSLEQLTFDGYLMNAMIFL